MKTQKDKSKAIDVAGGVRDCKGQVSRMAELKGEAAVKELPKTLPTPDFQGMREAYEKKFRAIEDRKVPSGAYVAKKLESVEKNVLKVERSRICARMKGTRALSRFGIRRRVSWRYERRQMWTSRRLLKTSDTG